MPENKDYLNVPDENGNVHISQEVLESITIGAAREVDGVCNVAPANALPDFMKKVASRGVRITGEEGALTIDLCLVVNYGVVIPEVAQKVQNSVASSNPMTYRAVERPSAKKPLSATTVTEERPFCVGYPVLGSMMWLYRTPFSSK